MKRMKRLLSVFLIVCLCLGMMPLSAMAIGEIGGLDGGNFPGDPRKNDIITEFQPLNESVKTKTVPYGTTADGLALPGRLKVIFDGSSTNAAVYGTKWTSSPEYNPKQAGNYVFFPTWTEGQFTFKEGITYPTITVTVEEYVPPVEKNVDVDSWVELQEAVKNLPDNEILNANITASLDADSKLDIDGKTVNLSTTAKDVSINRTLASEPNSTDAVFAVANNGSLTINGGENGIALLDKKSRQKSRGLIYATSGATVALSNVAFKDLNFGSSASGNGHGAVYASKATVLLDDVTMTHCVGDDGVLIYASNSVVDMNQCDVDNATYWGNSLSYGGVVRVKGSDSNVTMTNCTIKNCGTAEANGAANSRGPVWLDGGTVSISDSTISGNMAMIGAGIMADGTNLSLNNVNVTNNTCRGDGYDPDTKEPNANKGNVLWWQGAGMYIEDSTLTMSKVNITGNTGAFIGGGMYIHGTDVTLDETVNISGNSAVCGGGIYADDNKHTVTLDGAVVQNNQAVKKDAYNQYSGNNGCGGGIGNDGGTIVLKDATISGNTAAEYGGGILNYGGVFLKGDTKVFGNNANRGQGAFVCAGAVFDIQDAVVIDQANDVALEGVDVTNDQTIPSAYITVSAPFNGATKANPINITSLDVSVEDLNISTDGTPLVLYTDDSGGANAAMAADANEIFVPSQAMQKDLLIGRSQKVDNQQWLTYVKERVVPSYDVTYKDSKIQNSVTDRLAHGTQIVIDPNSGVLKWQNSAWDNDKSSEKQTLTLNADMTVPNPTRPGYRFHGWEKTGTAERGYTLTAQWQSTGGGGTVAKRYTLSYKSNGGTEYANQRYVRNTVVKLDKVPAREGYMFTGWYADKELTQAINEIKMTSDKTVYAGWQAASVPELLNGKDHFAYVVGYPDGNVHPSGNITRAETASIFFRLLKDDVRDSHLTTNGPFEDVVRGSWYSTSVCTMAELGIVRGHTENTFAPMAPITRAEFAAICARFDTGVTNGDSNFTDIDGHWAKEEIEHAAALGWVQGAPDGCFRPDASITRAEAMAMINRVLCRIPEKESDLLSGMNVWPDNMPGTWYYLAVQEATNSHDFERRGEVFEKWTKLIEDPNWSRYE